MKKLFLASGMLISFSFTTFASDSIKGKCSSLKGSKYSLSFELVQTDYSKQIYLLKGTRKAFVSRKKFELDSKFFGVYKNQFYSFSFVADFIKDSANLLIKKEEFRKEAEVDDAFIVNQDGYILDSLSCLDLNH